MWYHDHAVGITRLNAYAGLAAAYFLVDGDEMRMFGSGGKVLPDQIPGIPLVLQDKSFKNVADQWGRVGDLDYPSSYGPQEDPVPGLPTWLPLPHVSCVPEFFGDTPVINGMAYPQLTLPAGVHRFRMLNGTQSRVWNLQLYKESAPIRATPTLPREGTRLHPDRHRGRLPARAGGRAVGQSVRPRQVPRATTRAGYSLVLAGAERADVLINFSDCAGQSFILYNDAPSPFPDGDRGDYYTGSSASAGQHPGPNTRTLMRITITSAGGGQTVTDAALLAALDHGAGAEPARAAGRRRHHRDGVRRTGWIHRVGPRPSTKAGTRTGA